jgi:predicted RNA binding protein with dsRBD fold (UPF0201 family)
MGAINRLTTTFSQRDIEDEVRKVFKEPDVQNIVLRLVEKGKQIGYVGGFNFALEVHAQILPVSITIGGQ